MKLYPWLKPIYKKILKSYYINKAHHAIILYSKQDYGEDILIQNIVQWLICINQNDMQYCESCRNCCLIRAGYHPDYYKLVVNNDIQFISIDMMRNCINFLHKKAQYGKIKVVFIKYVEYLTHQAANILLKTIEEPPANTYFFLITKNDTKISLTLSSRCIKWIILPPSEPQGLSWLMEHQNNIDLLSAQIALRLSCGSPIEAAAMFQLNSWQYRIKLCTIIKIVLGNGHFLDLLPFLSNIQQYGNQPLFWLITILIDSLKWQQKIQKKLLINLDQLYLISKIATRWNILSLNNQVQQWLIVFYYFQRLHYINHELILTYRLLNWKIDIIETDLIKWSI